MIRKLTPTSYSILLEETTDLYPYPELIPRFVVSIHLDAADVDFQGSGRDIWNSVIRLVEKQDKIDVLLKYLLNENPDRETLHSLQNSIRDGSAFKKPSDDFKVPPEIYNLINQVKDFVFQSNQLTNITNMIQNAEFKINQNYSDQNSLVHNINNLRNDNPSYLTGNDLNRYKESQNERIRIELEKLSHLKNVNNSDLSTLEEYKIRKQQISILRISEIRQTLNALDQAIEAVEKLENNFDKYIWLIYFSEQLSLSKLNPEELQSLSEMQDGTRIKEKYYQLCKDINECLEPEERADYDKYSFLRSDIGKNTIALGNLEKTINAQRSNITSYKNKLKKITLMKGFSDKKLRIFNRTGFTLLGLGAFACILSFVLTSNIICNGGICDLILGGGSVLFLTGLLLLIVRAIYDKEERLKNINLKLEKTNEQYLKNDNAYTSTKVLLEDQNRMMVEILKRRPILVIVPLK